MKIYIQAGSAVAALGILNFLDQRFSISSTVVPGFDVLLHFLGGVGLALSALALYESIFSTDVRSHKGAIALIVCAVFAAGLIWELFEAYYDIAGDHVGTIVYYVDTIKDLIDDVLGAVLALWLVRPWNRTSQGKN